MLQTKRVACSPCRALHTSKARCLTCVYIHMYVHVICIQIYRNIMYMYKYIYIYVARTFRVYLGIVVA